MAEWRRGAEYLKRTFAFSKRRACNVVEVASRTKRSPSGRTEEAIVVTEEVA
jgi:hypothetical protein